MKKSLFNLPARFVLALIRLYQKTLSPDHGPLKTFFPYGYCKYDPTCSEYGYQSIEKYGLVIGLPRTVWRVLRCNPCSKGGYDPVIKDRSEY